MADTLSILSEAERRNIDMKSTEVDIQKVSGEIAELEVQMNELRDKKAAVEATLQEKQDEYEAFLAELPEELDAEQVKKLAAERVSQLSEAGLLDGIAASAKPKTRGRKPGSKNTKGKKAAEEKPADKPEAEDKEKPIASKKDQAKEDPIETLAAEEAPVAETGDVTSDDSAISELAEETDQGEGEMEIEVPNFLK